MAFVTHIQTQFHFKSQYILSPHVMCSPTLGCVSDRRYTPGGEHGALIEGMKTRLVRGKKVTERNRLLPTEGSWRAMGGGGVMKGGGWGGLLHRLVVRLTSPCQTVTAPYTDPPLNRPPLQPSLDRMINGVSGDASRNVPDSAKHYHNFFWA